MPNISTQSSGSTLSDDSPNSNSDLNLNTDASSADVSSKQIQTIKDTATVFNPAHSQTPQEQEP
ncbi:hypothetical protein ACS8FD_20865, partial [Psychrobacter sp. 1U2]